MRVVVTDYNPDWPAMFEVEAAHLQEVFAEELVSIHHIGSTSVAGLRAKPIIDIMPVVRKLETVAACDVRMIALGYEPLGEFGIPGRRYFRKGGDARTHNVHIFQADNTYELARHLAFRDYLRAHPEAAAGYGRLKATLAARFPGDLESYMAGKDALVKDLERQALAWRGGLGQPPRPADRYSPV